MAIAKIKNFVETSLKTVSQPLTERAAGSANLEPEVGVRIVHSPNEKKLKVTILGARHLPQNFGFTRVNSYVVKVKLIPGKDKFETSTRNESWPQWNEEFVFPLRKETKAKFGKTKVVEEEIGASKFIVATLYAILEDKPLIATDKKDPNEKEKSTKPGLFMVGKENKKTKEPDPEVTPTQTQQASRSSKLLGQLFGNKGSDKISETAAGSGSERKAFEKRRTIGATTIALDPRNFTAKPVKPKHPQDVSTGDMWRTLKPISSGISGAEERRENKKGQAELILLLEKSDRKDMSAGRLVLSLNRLRCSLQSMHEHEGLKGQLYVKMSVVDAGKVTTFWKSERFSPCISMKYNPEEAKVVAENPYEGALKDVSFVVKFVSKNKIGKKVTVGSCVIGPEVSGVYGEQWKQAMAKPGQAIVKWQSFE